MTGEANDPWRPSRPLTNFCQEMSGSIHFEFEQSFGLRYEGSVGECGGQLVSIDPILAR